MLVTAPMAGGATVFYDRGATGPRKRMVRAQQARRRPAPAQRAQLIRASAPTSRQLVRIACSDNWDTPPAGHHPHLQMQIEAMKPQERWAFHAVGVELGSGSSAQAAVQVHGKVGQGGT